jgi:ribokinase
LDSASFAAAVAAISVTRTGAQPSMPSMAEVEEFLENESNQIASEFAGR